MPATKTSLQGGGFQDAEGGVLANGYLIMELSQDATVVGVGNVAAGIAITIQLDGNGNVLNATSPGQQVWGNDNLLPVNTFYRVTGYTAAGQPAWGPNNQQVMGGSPFNLGTWVPNQVISWVPSVQGVTLETNGVPNVIQSLQNLESSDASVTITDLGNGTVNLQTAGGGPPTGIPFGAFAGPGLLSPNYAASYVDAVNLGGRLQAYAFVLAAPMTISKITADVYSVLDAVNSQQTSFGIYNASGTLLLDSGPFGNATASGTLQTNTIAPVTLPVGMYYLAVASTSNHVQTLTVNSSTYFNYAWSGLTVIRVGYFTSSYTGTTMPGTFSALTADNSLVPPVPLFE